MGWDETIGNIVLHTDLWSPLFLLGVFCGVKDNLQRYLREMKDVFKELKVLDRKRNFTN